MRRTTRKEWTRAMGELSKADADASRHYIIGVYQEIKESVRKNFIDMDFENADKRVETEGCLRDMPGGDKAAGKCFIRGIVKTHGGCYHKEYR